jgi:hypothetical protein
MKHVGSQGIVGVTRSGWNFAGGRSHLLILDLFYDALQALTLHTAQGLKDSWMSDRKYCGRKKSSEF